MNLNKDTNFLSRDERLKRIKDLLSAPIRIPLSTYRLQLNKDFTFSRARAIIPYLSLLGVSHCYTSPYLAAEKNSMHGYDICDYNRINPEIGDDSDYNLFIDEISRNGMGHILDFVPNHMGISSSGNEWWQDVLENGQCSPHADFFDIDWNPAKPELNGKILLPVLGDQYGNVLERGELVLKKDAKGFFIQYFDYHLPTNPQSIPLLLSHNLPQLENNLGKDGPTLMEYLSIISAFKKLPLTTETDIKKIEERKREKEIHWERLNRLINESPGIRHHLRENLKIFNGIPGQPESFDLLHELLESQVYRLSSWRTAAHEINYRRFFDINHLAGIRMENKKVFERTHSLVLKLIGEGKITGIRLDHSDGLFNPRIYFERLQEAVLLHYVQRDPEFGKLNPSDLRELIHQWREKEKETDPGGPVDMPLHLIIEKILSGHEVLPEHWAVHGTSGYDFLNDLNGLFIDSSNEKFLTRIYSRYTGLTTLFPQIVYTSKKLIMQTGLTSELNVLVRIINRISEDDRRFRDFTLNSLREALTEVAACLPIYRTYIDEENLDLEDRETLENSISRARSLNPALEPTIFDFLRNALLLDDSFPLTESDKKKRQNFIMKFQQFTSPVQAKGLEDTAFYRYYRLVSLNEVGGQPQRFGLSVSAFHARNQKRQKNWKWTLLNTATHDHKRGEDVRARINILSEIPDDWRKAVQRWSMINRSKRTHAEEDYFPDKNDEYHLYQILVGVWPSPHPDRTQLEELTDRVLGYMRKAAKESKVHTSWINPNDVYDSAITKFVQKILAPKTSNRFLDSFLPFQGKIAKMGMVNSLAQVLIKLTSPGIPDIYQGCELWDLSLVDPDNRRPVDFEKRSKLLEDLQPILNPSSKINPQTRTDALIQMLNCWEDGQIKMFVTACGLRFRKENPGLFLEGDYLPLQIEGPKEEHLIAFARNFNGTTAITIAPRLVAGLMKPEMNWPTGSVWRDTHIVCPQGLLDNKNFYDLFTRIPVSKYSKEGNQNVLYLEHILSRFPLALLVTKPG